MFGAVGRLEGIKVLIWLAVAELQNVLILSFQGQDECRWVVFWWKLDQQGSVPLSSLIETHPNPNPNPDPDQQGSPEEDFCQACHGLK